MQSPIWYPVAVVLSLVNFVGLIVAVLPAEPWHATLHAVLALAFALWAQRLRLRRRMSHGAGSITGETTAGASLSGAWGAELESGRQDQLDAIGFDVQLLREQLAETQERLDFAERLLAERSEEERRRAE